MSNDDLVGRVVQGSKDLNADIAFYNKLGFRLDQIFPADDPQVAILSGHHLSLRLDRNLQPLPTELHLLSDHATLWGDLGTEMKAPNGCRVKLKRKTYQLVRPQTKHKFEVRKLQDGEPWVIGRAGMHYRDLLPDRLGGSIIASHIRIPTGGPVPDVVHYHTIGFQLIFCYKGWVKLVYEDQGPPFVLEAGECVTQPPEIRHRVLEASDQLEVIEIGVPSEHMTTIDHEMELPTEQLRPDRRFQGQLFCRHTLAAAHWQASPWQGFKQRDTGVHRATNGQAAVTVRNCIQTGHQLVLRHQVDILFTFILSGSLRLSASDLESTTVRAGEAFVVPPDLDYQISNTTTDLELLEVSLPGTSEIIEKS